MVLFSATARRFAGWLVPSMCLVATVAAIAGGLADRKRSRLLVPEPVALGALEAGARPPRVHLEISTHYALLGSVLPVQRAGGDDENSESRFYTPLVSSPPANPRGGEEPESSLDRAPKSGLRVLGGSERDDSQAVALRRALSSRASSGFLTPSGGPHPRATARKLVARSAKFASCCLSLARPAA